MYLLQLSDRGELSLTKHDTDRLPPFAVLSHTWGADEDEVTFSDVQNGLAKSKPGYAKILFCGQRAEQDDLKHFWVDTCCIDKPNQAELSEAINSMFRWYSQAEKCYVYLQDVSTLKRDRDSQGARTWETAFRRSRWFTRGWTLQELLAPKEVEFWSRDGTLLGTKQSLQDLLHEITDIPLGALCGAPLSNFTTNERFRWAARRETKKKEDRAYSLLGIFNVFIPPIYGEGDNAYIRLKREVQKHSEPPRESSIPVRSSTLSETDRRERRERALASLGFDQMDARHDNVKDAQRTTCEWILQHPAYVAWDEKDKSPRQRGILWIAGKPGAGKSTLVKYALSQAKKRVLADEIVISFFFNARGDDLEKTTLGMYRALLRQLLDKAPDLQSVLDSLEYSNLGHAQSSTWSLKVLQELLSAVMQRLGHRRVKCFIDALDECNEQQVRDMVEYLEDLEEDMSGNGQLYICFASRHYPTIDIRHSWRLVLEDEAGHAEDLRKYIQRRLQAGNSRLIGEIRDEVHEKANGVFMWAVLVVNILNEEFRRGRIFAVKNRLREIPSELSDLFRDILRRDRVNMEDFLLCLQWILFARRPLRREEFYFAMAVGLSYDTGHIPEWKTHPWDPEEVTIEDMNRFVLNSSKGLAELARSKKAPTVQFIHESVRDFLMKDGGLLELWPEFDENLISSSHDKLKKCCLEYLTADLTKYLDPNETLPKASSEEAKTLRQEISNDFPLLAYASKEILYHADVAAEGIGQEPFLGDFAFDQWIYVNNIFEGADIRRYDRSTSLLYVLAERDCPRLIEALHCSDTWLRIPEARYKCAVVAAFANGNQASLQALLGEDGAAFMADIEKDPGFGKASHLSRRKDALLWAVEHDNWGLAECIVTLCSELSTFSFASRDWFTHAVEIASRKGRQNLVKIMLDKGAHVDAQDGQGDAFLLTASGRGHEWLVQLLLDKGVDVNAHNAQHDNALQAASNGGHKAVVQLLLDNGADVNAEGGLFGTPLQAASASGHQAVVRLLLDHGADVNAQIGFYFSTLHAASERGHEAVVRLLLDHGADVNAIAPAGSSALEAAIRRGQEDVVKLLRANGAMTGSERLDSIMT